MMLWAHQPEVTFLDASGPHLKQASDIVRPGLILNFARVIQKRMDIESQESYSKKVVYTSFIQEQESVLSEVNGSSNANLI